MLNPGLYIHGAGFIAPDDKAFGQATRLTAVEPDYTGIIPPMQLRRMSKAVRMSIGAAYACLAERRPDAIAVGTALGCLQDTEVFLSKMVGQDERMLTPTAFIQSTHNTVAGQIALLTGCHGFNTTISQRGHSFEGAVVSAALYLTEHPEHSVLCGGVDEGTDSSYALMQRMGMFRELGGGEGAGFILASRNGEGAVAQVSGLKLFSDDSRNSEDVIAQVADAMAEGGGFLPDDGLWVGVSGEGPTVQVYNHLIEGRADAMLAFKHNTGDWGTAVAVAIARIAADWPAGRSRIWIINHYGRDWSVWLLER